MTKPVTRWLVGIGVALIAFLAGRASVQPPAVAPVAAPSTPRLEPGPAAPSPARFPAPAPSPWPTAAADAGSAEPPLAGPSVDELKARLAGAYIVGGAADPLVFPAEIDPAYTPAAVQAWADSLVARCPAAAGATIEVDCGEYPCVVVAGWIGDTRTKDVLCVRPDLAGGKQSDFSGKVEGAWIRGILVPVGPPQWSDPEEAERFERRWDLRSRELRSLLVERMTAAGAAGTP